ncbi:hypothetical protein C2845_PM16G10120 [Panicum miliaceum]|uniref:Wax synthase domain-containing protein n=1 Tax=Panicum miliaceum TaxID=4540 RepID=A0A3L6PUN9_PANMI|nr:hypothetical protein C2845_PM16G10120 [Panicum miliaceum]
MELMRDSIPTVSLVVSAAALYARVGPGLPRLTALLPAVACFAAAPFAFSSAVLRCSAALSLAWPGIFKVGLLAAGRGPLDPASPALRFVLAAALPVELTSGAAARSEAEQAESLVTCALKAAFTAELLLRRRRSLGALHLYARVALYGAHVWCALELAFASAAAACGAALGGVAKVRPAFVRPYLATSLRDLWGRRWNLPASTVLRAAVYEPVRARAGKEAGILAAFLVSGVMHEVLVYYFTLRRPTGEMAAYFLLHGACRVAEEWCARRWAARGWPAPPRPVATLLVWVFVVGTSSWLVLVAVCQEGREEALLNEPEAVAAFFAAPIECSAAP